MSWKSFITASLLCILATPVFAAAVPQLEVVSDGLDPATGQFVWYVRVAPSDGARTNAAGPSTGSPMAVELGFRTNTAHVLTSVDNIGFSSIAGNPWDTDTPGKTIFGWEDKYQIIDPNTLLPTGTLAGEGIEVYCGGSCGSLTLTNGANRPSGAGNNHPTTADVTDGGFPPANGVNSELFVALGSNVLSDTNTTSSYALRNPNLMVSPGQLANQGAIVPQPADSNATTVLSTNVLKVMTTKPVALFATDPVSISALQLLGSHGAANNEGRVAEITSGTQGTNYKGFTGSASLSIKPGDINLDAKVDVLDLGILAPNIGGGSGKNWTFGDFNGDGVVDVLDLGILAPNIGATGGSYGRLTAVGVNDPASGEPLGGSGLEGAGVPEPASVALLGLALLGGLGLMRRRA